MLIPVGLGDAVEDRTEKLVGAHVVIESVDEAFDVAPRADVGKNNRHMDAPADEALPGCSLATRATHRGSAIRSASEWPSSTRRNASNASLSTPFRPQADASGQVFVPRSKHSTSVIVPSVRRTTSPRRMRSGDAASANPPSRPRVVWRYPRCWSSLTTFT